MALSSSSSRKDIWKHMAEHTYFLLYNFCYLLVSHSQTDRRANSYLAHCKLCTVPTCSTYRAEQQQQFRQANINVSMSPHAGKDDVSVCSQLFSRCP